ncbi:hypothetical protein AALP_AA4G263400 [Arabis alpina]|uniref:non-specific serine/threonine protein kinase n=1 Tax=Arabis alpina TaxID=50452 RepID=A0A087H5T2_ARAAL|nr:hypothetical protein AALP_AA4G263400 [Arabis alpina]
MNVVTSHHQEEDIFGAEGVEIHPMDFGLVLKATNNFSNEIGEGGFGKVYKGKLHDGQEIAVKKLSEMSKQGSEEFYTEYLENGNLESHLFGNSQSSGELNWQVRFDIIKGIARGLAYMEERSRGMIIHRDLKPSNILLDKDMTPKISDFGLARICERSGRDSSTTKLAGTFGYMSPEYAARGKYSKKLDIFSFGVIVLEIVTGKRNTSFSPSTNLPSYVSFLQFLL